MKPIVLIHGYSSESPTPDQVSIENIYGHRGYSTSLTIRAINTIPTQRLFFGSATRMARRFQSDISSPAGKQARNLIQPHSTITIDVTLLRLPSPDVYQLIKP